MAIEGVTADVAANKNHAPWYSLAGDRAPNPHKGIYQMPIMNGETTG